MAYSKQPMDTVASTLHEHTFTVVSMHRRIALLKELLEEVVYEDAASESGAKRWADAVAALAAPDDRAALQALGTEWVDTVDTQNLGTTVQQLRETVSAAPTMTVYVPVAFDAAAEESLGTWCRREIAPDLLLELTVDPAVVGGCAFVREHTYHDYSFASRLRHTPEAIPRVINAYV